MSSDARATLHLDVLLDYRVIQWGLSVAWVAILLWQGSLNAELLSSAALSLLPWVVLHMVVHLLPVSGWQSAQLVADWPIQAAAALVLSPIEVAIVAFVASIDPRELTRTVPFRKALFNRSMIGIISYAGASAIRLLAPIPSLFQLMPLAFMYLAVTALLNFTLVGALMAREQSVRLSEAFDRLRPAILPDFVLTFVTGGVLGAMIAVLFEHVGWPGLLVALAPTLLGRQVLNRSQMVVDTTRAYQSKDKAIVQMETQIYEERSEERKLIAADLHDEVLQPLFKVTLMAHVLKADLASGRLLEIDADLPELLSAAETASNTLRDLIGDLRKSSIGVGGLVPALTRLIDEIRRRHSLEISDEIQAVDPDPVSQQVLYQVAKETLSNLVTHSRAKRASIQLKEDYDYWMLEITDDGIGFDQTAQADEGHFGILIMKERTTALGGAFFLDSAPRMGCRVRAMLPRFRDGHVH